MTLAVSRGRVRGRGRPRAEVDAAIRDAALALLATEGYQRLSMAGVALAAGISKPALYRRYPSKAELVATVLLGLTTGPPPELPKDTRAALLVLLRAAARALATPGALTILGSLLAQEQTDPELAQRFRDVVFRPQQVIVAATLTAGQARGQVVDDLDIEVIDAMLFGALLARASLGEPVSEAWLERMLATVWVSIARSGADAAG